MQRGGQRRHRTRGIRGRGSGTIQREKAEAIQNKRHQRGGGPATTQRVEAYRVESKEEERRGEERRGGARKDSVEWFSRGAQKRGRRIRQKDQIKEHELEVWEKSGTESIPLWDE